MCMLNFSVYLCFLVDAKQAQGFLSFFKTLPHVSSDLFSRNGCGSVRFKIVSFDWKALFICLVAEK